MKKLKLLIVDDEPGIREGVKRVLTGFSVDLSYIGEIYSLDVTTAESGEEAIEFIERQKYDLILLDNKLPGRQGTEVLEYLSIQGTDTLTLMMTAYASVETAVAATKNGAYDFLVKPFTPDEVKIAVSRAGKHLILTRLAMKLTKEKQKIRFQFLSTVSHELKAPIDAVAGYLRMMEERAAGERVDDYERIIARSLSRLEEMRKLILDLLDLTKIESGERQRNFELVNLAEIAQNMMDNYKNQALEKKIVMSLQTPEQVFLKGDRVELKMIFNNLISNAVKYNKDEGNVWVVIEENDRTVTIKVADSGIGMAANETQELFKEFCRIKNAKTRNIKGSGLGLSIVKRIVSLYTGSITAESSPGKGTVFTVVFPKCAGV